MILTILEAVAVLWIAAFFGVTTWAVWYYGRDLHREVTQYPPHRNGWDHLAEDEYDSVTASDWDEYRASVKGGNR